MTDQKTNRVLGASRLSAGLGWFKRVTCLHEFDLDDLRRTGIPEPEMPTGTSYKEMCEYFHNRYEHESVTKRVAWPCCKCGKIFYAHCGLDIYSYGKPKKRMPNA
jgi:hypothetical protein